MNTDEEEFVKEDEQNSDNEQEQQMENALADHKKNNKKNDNRPESKHGRPESSKQYIGPSSQRQQEESPPQHQEFMQERNQDYEDEEKEEQHEPSKCIQKLSKHINVHHINLETFWRSNQIFISMQEFCDYLTRIGLPPSNQDIEIYEEELTDGGFIQLKKLCEKVEPWHNKDSIFMDFIREKTNKMAQDYKKKVGQQFKITKNARPKSSQMGYASGRPISGISMKSQKSKLSGIEDMKMMTQEKPPAQNKSKQYLKQHNQKKEEEERLLQLTINKGKNEYEYDMLIKMGEANELSQLLNYQTTFRAYKGAKGNLKVHQYELDKFTKDMTLEEFQREYNALQNTYKEKQNKKIWEVLSENKKAKQGRQFQKGTGYEKEEEVEQEEQGGKTFNKKQRQKELKKVLLETMTLTIVLKEQLAVLNRKGINQYQQQQTQPQTTGTTTFVNHSGTHNMTSSHAVNQ